MPSLALAMSCSFDRCAIARRCSHPVAQRSAAAGPLTTVRLRRPPDTARRRECDDHSHGQHTAGIILDLFTIAPRLDRACRAASSHRPIKRSRALNGLNRRYTAQTKHYQRQCLYGRLAMVLPARARRPTSRPWGLRQVGPTYAPRRQSHNVVVGGSQQVGVYKAALCASTATSRQSDQPPVASPFWLSCRAGSLSPNSGSARATPDVRRSPRHDHRRGIASGSAARVATRPTARHRNPTSIANAASLAVPMPTSSTTGTGGTGDDHLDIVRVGDTKAGAIGEPSGITAAQPVSSSRRAQHRVVGWY